MTDATQSFRLPGGGQVHRDRLLSFRFDGRLLSGFKGDTLASALLANGVRLVGRSFKFHRPRGILSAGAEEPNALVQVGTGAYAEPNVRATWQPLYDGLIAASQNCWPTVRHDVGAVFDLTAGLWPAGFYNKTFMWPHWHWYEGTIRRIAGLGRLPEGADPDRYVHRNAHCDVLICGAGPAGLAAAISAAQSGARVILAEQDREAGGSLLWGPAEIDGKPGAVWAADTCAALSERDNVQVLMNTTVAGCFDHHTVLLAERLHHRHSAQTGPQGRLWIVRAKEIIVAAGAVEQPLLFPNNDRPGILLASAVQHYAVRYAVAAGRQVVLVTNNLSGYHTALALADAGVTVLAVIDVRTEGGSDLPAQVRARGIAVHSGCIVLDTQGRHGVQAVTFAPRDDHARNGHGTPHTVKCDCIGMSGGWQPTVHLLSQNRGSLHWDAGLGAFLPDALPAHMHVVGAANGQFNLAKVLADGDRVGLQAAMAVGLPGIPHHSPPACEDTPVSVHAERFAVRQHPERQWVDFQHDVSVHDIDIAVRENYVSVEHMKRYTTTGMSVDQGKTSNLNALIALAERTQRDPSQVGTTTFRPFYTPVTLGAIAGRRHGQFYAPTRESPLATASTTLGAVFRDYGTWRRPAAYLQSGEDLDEAVRREARAVRTAVGIYDASPLGKIEVRGPGAAEFLNRIYVNNVLSLKVGQARYGIMLNDNGVILDDGILVRIAAEHFLVHASSGNADRVYACLEEWLHGEWPSLQVLLTPVTSQWATLALAGPRARDVLGNLAPSLALPDSDFAHMRWRAGEWDGIPVRILRASFTGELGFEISVPADYGAALWQALLTNGEPFRITPFGVESLLVLRTEKGYLHVGSDTDGTTTPDDIGWGDVVRRKTADFIGKRSLSRPHNRRPDRLQFVGLQPLEPRQAITTGAHVVGMDIKRAPAPTQGYVTSACFSPTLERWIALGLVRTGRDRLGAAVNLFHADQLTPAQIVSPTFYDPEGTRLHD